MCTAIITIASVVKVLCGSDGCPPLHLLAEATSPLHQTNTISKGVGAACAGLVRAKAVGAWVAGVQGRCSSQRHTVKKPLWASRRSQHQRACPYWFCRFGPGLTHPLVLAAHCLPLVPYGLKRTHKHRDTETGTTPAAAGCGAPAAPVAQRGAPRHSQSLSCDYLLRACC